MEPALRTLQDFLEVRGLGIINVRELFGDSAIKKEQIPQVDRAATADGHIKTYWNRWIDLKGAITREAY